MLSDKEKLLDILFDTYYGHLKGGYVLTAKEYEDTKHLLLLSGVFESRYWACNSLITLPKSDNS
jgi:hypothetical protein